MTSGCGTQLAMPLQRRVLGKKPSSLRSPAELSYCFEPNWKPKEKEECRSIVVGSTGQGRVWIPVDGQMKKSSVSTHISLPR